MIRKAELKDVKHLVDLIEDFYDEAPYEAPSVHREQSEFVFHEMVKAQWADPVKHFLYVIEVQGKVRGAILAERIPDLWSEAEKVVEHFIYVTPKLRGGIQPGKLLATFAKWTKIRPAVVRVEAASGLDDDKVGAVFERMGWHNRGTLYGSEAY
jgi:N-acetylglutamate synthase-like GNAT family acetyltransferase